MRELLLMFLQLRRSDIGRDIFTCGLIMLYMRSLMLGIWSGQEMCTGIFMFLQWIYVFLFHISLFCIGASLLVSWSALSLFHTRSFLL
ncbi:hypothetical protein Gotur_000194 [Gossypium turneri]